MYLQDTIKQLKEEMSIIEESQSVFSTFSDWLSTAQKNFSSVTTTTIDVVDRVSMEKKMKKLEVRQIWSLVIKKKHLYTLTCASLHLDSKLCSNAVNKKKLLTKL